MPLVRQSGKLPGTDPHFHEMRLYLSFIKYKGRDVLAHHASCKHAGCKFSKAWVSNEARNIGIWIHRSEKVREARRDYFVKKYSGNLGQIEAALLATSDKHSTDFDVWADNIWTLYRGRTGVLGDIDKDNPQLKVDYHLGLTAREVAANIYAANYDS